MVTSLLTAMSLLVAAPPESDLSDRAREIFEIVETGKETTVARPEVLARLVKVAPKASDDHRLRLAYVVALMHERRYADALRDVNALAKSRPQYLEAQRIRAWLLMWHKKYPEAVAALETVAKLLPSQDDPEPLEMGNLGVAQFLGTAVGFLDGPGEKLVKETLRVQGKEHILTRLNDKQRQAFEASYQAVARQFEDICKSSAEAFAKADKKRQESVQVVLNKEHELDKTRADTKAYAEKTSQQLRDEWKRLETQWSQLHEVWLQINNQAAELQAEYRRVSSRLASLERVPRDKDGKMSSADRAEYDRWAPGLRRTLSNLDDQLARVQLAAQETAQRGAMIEYQANQIAAAGQELGETFALKEQIFDKHAQELAVKEARAKKRGPKAPKISEQARLFATYQVFSFDQEKQRILDSLPAQ